MDPAYFQDSRGGARKEKHVGKTVGIIVAVVVVLALLGVAIYFGVKSAKCGDKSSSKLSNAAGVASADSGVALNVQDSYADGCYRPPASYDPSEALSPTEPALVPPYQAAVQSLPAMQQAHFQQEYAGTGIGPSRREGIDPISSSTFDSTTFGPDEDYGERVKQTAGVGVSAIYSRGDGKGISLINQKSRMLDPTKMLPQTSEACQADRMVQAGPSIADIKNRVPKAADIMRMLRASRGNALSYQIPREKPPLYTEGLNAFRPTPLPQSTGDNGCVIGISPYEVSDLIEYTPNPFLQRSRSTEVGYNYTP